MKQIYLTLRQLLRQVWLLPSAIATAIERRKQQSTRKNLEAERLDRIRNPSKYLGRP